jgi:hypothetical protein
MSSCSSRQVLCMQCAGTVASKQVYMFYVLLLYMLIDVLLCMVECGCTKVLH